VAAKTSPHLNGNKFLTSKLVSTKHERMKVGNSTIIVLLLVYLSAVHCTSPKKVIQQPATISIEDTIAKYLGKPHEVLFNTPKSYALAFETRSMQADHVSANYKFVVIDCTSMKVLSQGSYQMGWIRWQSDQVVEYTSKVSVKGEPTVEKIVISAH
jgi:hypothetical protein